ncbi:MAG: AAA family ATPase [Betaproteobacteria bacterium]|nr:MAG: AAA family ATPase [Betaproteobacteria bacterium]
MSDVRQWLAGLGLGEYAEVFEAEQIEFEDLGKLDTADLKEMGLPIGPRKRVLEAIDAISSSDHDQTGSGKDGVLSASALQRESERRQLTVLFCDMVGYTELASRLDPEVLQRIVRAYEDTCAAAITRFDGYVFQRLGDGIVAFFGYPLAHESEAERAIRAGLDILDAMSALKIPEVDGLSVRIGISTGLVVVASAEKGAVGETMNLASRLQGIAKVNTMVVSERVRHLAGGAFDYEDLGEQTLKGIARPTHAYRVTGISAAASRFEAATGSGITPLVGREHEFGLLMDRWQLAREGEGQAVLLSGEPGIGKSRILNALRQRLEGESHRLMTSQCSPFHANTAFYPIAVQLSRGAGFERHDDAEVKLNKLEDHLSSLSFNQAEVVPLFAAALSIPVAGRYPALNISPQKQKERTIAALSERVMMTAREHPLLFVVEDLHWADPTSREVLGAVIEAAQRARVLVVCTFRPEFEPPWPEHGHVTTLKLAKLARAPSREIVSTLAGGKDMPQDLVEQIVEKTDGVPLFVEEVTKSVLESGVLTDRGDRYEYTGDAESMIVPPTLRDSLMERLDRSLQVKEIAQIGAAIGREFSYELVYSVASLPQSQLEDALTQLTDSGLAFQRGAPPQAVYTFKHALVQDVAYDSLLKSKRQILHQAIAQSIEESFPDMRENDPELLSRHFERANRVEEAIAYRRRAGEQARTRSAYREAQTQFNEGLELLKLLEKSDASDRIELELLTVLGPVLMATEGQGSDSVRLLYERARQLCVNIGAEKTMFGVTFNLWTNKFLSGKLPAGRELSAELLASDAAYGDPGLMVQAHHTCWSTQTWSGNFRLAIDAADEGRRLYDPVRDEHHKFLYGGHDPRCCAGSFRSFSLWCLGYPDSAARARDETYQEMVELDHPFTSALIGTLVMQTFFLEENVDRFAQGARKVLNISERNGFPATLAWANASIGWTMVHQGNAEGLEVMEQAIRDIQRMGLHTQLSFYLGLKADALRKLDFLDDALACVDEALTMVTRNDEHYFEPELYRIKGEMLLHNGQAQPDAAKESLFEAIRVSRQLEAKSLELRAATSLANVLKVEGKRQEAHALVSPVYDWFTEGLATKDLKGAKALLDELGLAA